MASAEMDRARYLRLEALFDEAVYLEGPRRDEFLDRACAGDPQLRAEVERLLACDTGERSDDLPTGLPGLDIATAEPAPAQPIPERIGRYLVQGCIAEGGMGAVYLARQEHPEREVAIKIIHPGLVSDELLRRFRFEAELLGRLQHPGIAQIFEAGEAGAGCRQPFIAMEHIRGLELRAYAAEHGLTIPERVELLARVCDAVSHAHQRGIVHRDLKPQNILVVEEPTTGTPAAPGRAGVRFARLGQPKVLDFGISCLVRESARDETTLTRPGHVLGTPAYMSPEQAAGERAVDVRSDVYALGVIGFELLAGRLPRAVENTPLLDALRTIREQPAPRLDTVARELRGDLSVLIGKALETERERRYASAAALAEDLRRYLADQPIVARSPTLRYQLARFVRRNKVFVAASLLALSGLVAGLVLALLAQREEARQRLAAEQSREEAQRAAYSAQLQAARAYRVAGEPEPARALLEAGPAEQRGWEWDYEAGFAGADLMRRPMEIAGMPLASAAASDPRALFPVGARQLRLFDFGTGTWRDLAWPGQSAEQHGAIALIAGEQRALWGDPEGRIRFLDLERGEVLPVLVDLPASVAAVHVLAAERRAVVLTSAFPESPRTILSVIDLASGEVLRQREQLPVGYALDVSADGRRIAFGSRGYGPGRVLLLDAATLATIAERAPHDGDVRRVAFSPDGRWLASAGLDLTIRAWDLTEDRETLLVGRVRQMPHALRFHPDSRRLASGHGNGLILVWDVATARRVEVFGGGMRPRPEDCAVRHLAWDANGEVLRAVGLDGVRAHLLEPQLPEVLPHERGIFPFASDVAFAPSGRFLATAGWDGAVRIWDVATRQAIKVLDCSKNALNLAFAPDGDRLLVCSQLGYSSPAFRLWDTRTWRLVAERAMEDPCYCICYVPACDSVLLGFINGLRVIDPHTLALTSTRETLDSVRSIARSPDGQCVVLGLWNGQLEILDARTLQRRRVVEVHDGAVFALAFSPNGELLATGGADEQVRLLDPATGQSRTSLRIPGSQDVLGLLFSPDGRRLLVGSRQTSIGILETTSGAELARLQGHEAYVKALAWSPDGQVLASASGDCTVRLWDARPVRARVGGRREMLSAQEEVRPLVARLMGEDRTVEEVLAALEQDASLGELESYAAWVLVHQLDGK